jgi:uncharacterized protein YhdP
MKSRSYDVPNRWPAMQNAGFELRFFNDGLCMTRELNNMTAKIREGICVIHVNPRLLAKRLDVSF